MCNSGYQLKTFWIDYFRTLSLAEASLTSCMLSLVPLQLSFTLHNLIQNMQLQNTAKLYVCFANGSTSITFLRQTNTRPKTRLCLKRRSWPRADKWVFAYLAEVVYFLFNLKWHLQLEAIQEYTFFSMCTSSMY